MNGLENMFRSMREDHDEPPRPKLAPDIEAIRLRDALAALNTKHELRPGMIVRQKPQAKQYKDGGDNGLAIVVEELAEPIFNEGRDYGSSAYRARVDIVIGTIEAGPDGIDVFVTFHVDSRRFEPVPEAELSLMTGPCSNDAELPERAGPPRRRAG